jgi:hypothetical protein
MKVPDSQAQCDGPAHDARFVRCVLWQRLEGGARTLDHQIGFALLHGHIDPDGTGVVSDLAGGKPRARRRFGSRVQVRLCTR